MCTQTVGLIAAEIERSGIPTVAIQLLMEIAEKVRPPRGLWVPFRHGYPLGDPPSRQLRRSVVERALSMLDDEGPGPLLERFELVETPEQPAGL
ncbi:MAG: hypothetical protein WBX15_06265 [Thermoanaerobaculia bacterium]